MRSIFSCFLILLLTFGLAINEASAKRFGGGRSFGIQRSYNSHTPNSFHSTRAMGQKKFNSQKWGGVLGGLLIGGLLASLFMGHGFGSGLLTWLIIGLGIYWLVSFKRRRMPASFAAMPPSTFNKTVFNAGDNSTMSSNFNSGKFPLGFNAEEFLRSAKVTFIRLQAAYDQKNLHDLKAFTSPEVFAEIRMQLQERGDAYNHTEIINLDADLLNIATQADSTLASVRFIGTIQEDNQLAISLDEVWHFRKLFNSDSWEVSGIQQDISAEKN